MHQPQGTYARYYHVTRHRKAREDAVEESGEKTNENKVVSIYSFSFYFFLPFPLNFSSVEFSQLTAIDDFGNPPF